MTETELQNFDKVISIVRSYEANELHKNEAINLIVGIAACSHEDVYIDDYWRSVDIEDFVQGLVVEQSNPNELSDEDVKSIISEIRDTEDLRRMDYLISKHSLAIELRYKKNSGVLGDRLFHSDDTAEEIVEWLLSDEDAPIIL